MLLFRLRKAGRLVDIRTAERTTLTWEECDAYLFASEIAWQMLLDDERAESLDEILCDPELSSEFDGIARRFAPGFRPLDYRQAALKLRKKSKDARTRAASLVVPRQIAKAKPFVEFDPEQQPDVPGVYVLGEGSRTLYVGEAVNLKRRLSGQFHLDRRDLWWEQANEFGLSPDRLSLRVRPVHAAAGETLAWQASLVQRYRPRLNLKWTGEE
jgi:site-specific DNA-methyltransferase (adenine-specific)